MSGWTVSSSRFHVLRLTMPVAGRLQRFCSDWTARVVAGPKEPSTATPPRPAWSTLTGAPLDPGRRTVDLYAVNCVVVALEAGGGVGVVGAGGVVVVGVPVEVWPMRAAQVVAATTPVGVRPLAFW